MSVTRPSSPPARRPTSLQRPSRVKIVAIWLALLLGSFLFGMLIISPLLGVVASNPEKTPPPKPRSQSAPRPRASAMPNLPERPSLRVEDSAMVRRETGPGITLTPDDSDNIVQAADPVEQPQREEPDSSGPAAPQTGPTGPNGPTPPPTSLSVEESPSPQRDEGVQRGERID